MNSLVTDWEKIFVIPKVQKRFMSRIEKEYIQINKDRKHNRRMDKGYDAIYRQENTKC